MVTFAVLWPASSVILPEFVASAGSPPPVKDKLLPVIKEPIESQAPDPEYSLSFHDTPFVVNGESK